MSIVEAKRIFLEDQGKRLMVYGDYFKLTKLTPPYQGVLYKETEKLYFTFDLEYKCWFKRATKKGK